jgi:hypothetical protein
VDRDAHRSHQRAARLLGEYGIAFTPSTRRVESLVGQILADAELPIPDRLRRTLTHVLEEIRELTARVAQLERELAALADTDAVITRLQTIPAWAC